MSHALDILILAAGRGSRMKSDLPKVLHPVMGRPLIDHVIDAARALRPGRIGVIVGHRREMVAAALNGREDIVFVLQDQQNGTGHAIRCAAKAFAGKSKDVMILSGDVPLMRPETLRALYDRHRKERAAASLLTAVLDDPGSLGRVLRSASGAVDRIVEARDASPDEVRVKEINAGIYVFNNDRLFAGVKNLPRHPNGEYYLTDVVTGLIADRKKVVAEIMPDPSEAMGINTRTELRAAHETYRQRILDDHVDRGVVIVDPPNTFIAPGAMIGEGTVILPFSVILENVSVGARCRIGPFAHLRPGTVIAEDAVVGNFVEMKNASLGQRSAARHLTYLGDAKVGKDVNLGAGTITANFDGVQKHATTIEDGARIGSGVVLVAPVRVGKKGVVGAGAVVTKNHDVPPGSTAVGIPARVIAHTERRKDRRRNNS